MVGVDDAPPLITEDALAQYVELPEPPLGEGIRPGAVLARLTDRWAIVPEPRADPDRVVWHHTSADGLLGILRSRTVWATSLRSLNDRKEFTYGQRLFDRVLKSISDKMRPWEQRFLNYHFPRDLSESMRLDSYVFCATQTPDSLNQWQHYSRSQGYAIGFRLNSGLSANRDLDQAIVNDSPWFHMVYKPKQQKARAETALRWILENLGDQPPRIVRQVGYNFLASILSSFKHPAFAAEFELRASVDDFRRRVAFRPGVRGLVPYIPASFCSPDQPDEINAGTRVVAIMCAPGSQADQRDDQLNVRRLLDSLGYTADVRVRRSKVPYRF